MWLDVGTGDGRAAVAAAGRHPETLVIGLDAVADPMVETSRRAARIASKGGLPNALFVVASVERPPPELACRADLVTVRFPWGSLLRGVAGLEPRATAGLASLVAPGGGVEALVAVRERDGLAGLRGRLEDPEAIGDAWAAHGLTLVDAERVQPAELVGTGSTWAKRLGATTVDGRAVTRVRLVRLP